MDEAALSDHGHRKPDMLLKDNDTVAALLEFDKQMRAEAGFPLLTPSARVLLCVAAENSITVKDAMYESGTSDGAFFTILRRLKLARLVFSRTSKSDTRVRILSTRESD